MSVRTNRTFRRAEAASWGNQRGRGEQNHCPHGTEGCNGRRGDGLACFECLVDGGDHS